MASVPEEDGSTTDTAGERPRPCPPRTICRAQLWVDEHINLDLLLTEALQDPSIQFLDLYIRESFLARFSPHQIKSFMEKIGALPNLERLDISCPYKNHQSAQDDDNSQDTSPAYLPVAALQAALSDKLTHLLIANLKLSGSRAEFQGLADTTATLSRLHCVVLAEVCIKDNGDGGIAPKDNNKNNNSSRYSMLDPIVRSLGTLPALAHVLISGCHKLGTLQSSTLQALAASPSVRDLSLSQLTLTTQHFQALTPILCGANNNTIRELDLQCILTVDGARVLAHILEHNKTLEKLSLRLESPSQENDKDSDVPTRRSAAVQSFLSVDVGSDSDAQTANHQPQDYQVSADHTRNVILAEGIAKSKYLTSFELENANLSTAKLQEPFLNMLRYNYFLDTVRLNCVTTTTNCLEEEIVFYTRLNQMGRSHLFQCAHCSQCDGSYLSVLENLNAANDMSAVFYFLSQKPSLICVGGRSASASSMTASTKTGRGSSQQRLVLGKRKRLYRGAKYNRIAYT